MGFLRNVTIEEFGECWKLASEIKHKAIVPLNIVEVKLLSDQALCSDYKALFRLLQDNPEDKILRNDVEMLKEEILARNIIC